MNESAVSHMIYKLRSPTQDISDLNFEVPLTE